MVGGLRKAKGVSEVLGKGGTNGQKVEEFADEIEAGQALEAIARATRRRRYKNL
jgi:predicted DNA-binding WGR domain protein